MNRLSILFISLLSLISTSLLADSFNVTRWQTSKGTRVVFYRAMDVPMLTIQLGFAAGSAYDGHHFGLSRLTTSLLNEGNNGISASDMAETFADVGAQFESETSRDMVVLKLKTLTEPQNLKQAIDTLTLIVSKPDFPQQVFEQEKNQQLLGIMQKKESPDEVANVVFFNKLYADHPYAHSVIGTLKQVKAIQRQHVLDFYHHYFVASNAIVVMVGAIDETKARELAEQLTHQLPKGQQAKSLPKAAQLTVQEQVNVPFLSQQTVLRLGQVGINHFSPDYFPLMVGNYILGGGALVSRLANEVREKRGLTYGVESQLVPMPSDGPFIIRLATKNDKANSALQTTKQVLERFIAEGPTEDELVAAKKYLIGSFPLTLTSNGSIANMLLLMTFFHLPDDYLDTYTQHINAVSKEDIKRAFQKQVYPDKLLLVSVGKL